MRKCTIAVAMATAALLAAPTPATAQSSSQVVAFDEGCRPSARQPQPVVLLPAGGAPVITRSTPNTSGRMFELVDMIAAIGSCAYGMHYGLVAGFTGLGSIAESARQLAAGIEQIKAQTGAARVDVVAQSEGALVTNYYANLLGGAPNLRRAVYLSPIVHGSTVEHAITLGVIGNPAVGYADVDIPVGYPGGLAKFFADHPEVAAAITAATAGTPGPLELVKGSPTIAEVNARGITRPGIRYSVIAPRGDDLNTPAGTAAFIDEPGVTNVFFEDLFPGAGLVNHHGMMVRPELSRWIVDQLTSP